MLDVLDSVLDTVSVFAINALLPTRISLPIPIPPATCNAPVIVEIALVVDVIITLPILNVAGALTLPLGTTVMVIVDPLADNLTVSMFNEFGPTYKSAKGLSSVPKLTVLVVGTIFPPTSISPPTYIFCPMPTPPTTINDPESVDDAVVSLVIVII